MSDTQTDELSKSKTQNLITGLKRIMAEDPLIGVLTIILILPSGWIMWNAVNKMDTELVALTAGLIVFLVSLVFIPLIILKTIRQWKINIEKQRVDSVKEERKRRQISWQSEELRKEASWRKNQERADLVIEAKVKNLEMQTQFIMDQSDKADSYILKESAEKIRDGLEARFQEMEFVNTKTCAERLKLMLENFKRINTQYDSILVEIKTFQKTIEIISGSVKENKPEIHIFDSKLPPQETSSMDQKTNDLGDVSLKVESSTEKSYEAMSEKELKAALGIIDDLKDDTDLPITQVIETTETSESYDPQLYPGDKTPEEKPVQELPPNAWECPNCNRVNTTRQVRCPVCGQGQPTPTKKE